MSERVISREHIATFIRSIGIDPNTIRSLSVTPAEIMLEVIEFDESGKKKIVKGIDGDLEMSTHFERIHVR